MESNEYMDENCENDFMMNFGYMGKSDKNR